MIYHRYLSTLYHTNMSCGVMEGYSQVIYDGQRFLVPDFTVEDVKLRLSALSKRKEMGAEDVSQKVVFQLFSHLNCLMPFQPRDTSISVRSARVGEGLVRAIQEPVSPSSSLMPAAPQRFQGAIGT